MVEDCSNIRTCADNFTIEDARRKLDYLNKRIDECRDNVNKNFEKRKKAENEESRYGGSVFEKLVKSFIERTPTCRATASIENGVCGRTFAKEAYWALPELTDNGDALLKKIIDSASNGKLIDGKLIVEIAKNKNPEKYYAACFVRSIDGIHGPPKNCNTIAIVSSNQTLLKSTRVDDDFTTDLDSFSCPLSSSIRLGGTIDVRYEIETIIKIELFSELIDEYLRSRAKAAFEKKTYSSNDGVVYSIYYSATAPFRESLFLKGGWREAFDLDLSLHRNESGKIDFTASMRPAVSRQAVGTLIEYHGLDNVQAAEYANTLDSEMGDVLIKACSSAVRPDSKKIICK